MISDETRMWTAGYIVVLCLVQWLWPKGWNIDAAKLWKLIKDALTLGFALILLCFILGPLFYADWHKIGLGAAGLFVDFVFFMGFVLFLGSLISPYPKLPDTRPRKTDYRSDERADRATRDF